MKRLLKILAWTLMALLLFVAGSLMVAVRLLHPERLTPLCQAAANRYLNARVELGRAELNLQHAFPFLEIELKDLLVLSKDMENLPAESKSVLPAYSDTLLTLRSMKGSINLARLANNEIVLGDVGFNGLGANLVILNDSINNFNIIPPTAPDSDESSVIPSITIQRFALSDTRPFRYYNHADSTDFELRLRSFVIDGESSPRYLCDFRGALPAWQFNIDMLDSIPFLISGDVLWDASAPQQFGFENFGFEASVLKGKIDTHMDFTDSLMVKDLELKLDPLPLNDIIRCVPEEFRRSWNLPEDFATSARPEIELHLDRQYNLSGGAIPYATMDLRIAPSEIVFDKVTFSNFQTELTASTFGNDLDKATVELKKLEIATKAVDCRLSGNVTNIMTDPLFSGNFDGELDIRRLPRSLTRFLQGYASGRIKANLNVKGRPSMFAPGSYYKLAVQGRLSGNDLYWLSSDTVNMAYAHRLDVNFGNAGSVITENNERMNLLSANITIDSVNVLHTQYSFKATGFRFDAATKNQRRQSDSTAVTPMGGGLSIGTFDFHLLSDSIGVRARNLDGVVMMRAADGDIHRPKFDFNLKVNRLSTGDPSTRFMLSKADLNFSAYKLPNRRPPKELTKMADSIKVIRPELPMDSVYAMAIAKYRHKHRGRMPRVHAQLLDNETEIIEWGTSKMLRRLLLEWKVSGHVLSNRVSLFTPYFPMRNRIRNFNVRFNNDTVKLDNVEYKIGHSDFLLSGQITNLRRGLTSKKHTQSVKANFDVISDTIDVNQLADLTFRGAAYADGKDSKSLHLHEMDDDASIDSEIDRYVAGTTDSMAPLLIPRNIEASFNIKADNVLYSDLVLHKLGGRALVYGGALNLHDLRASSDIGSVSLSALYQAPNVQNLNFGFGLNVKRFDIHGFLRLVPAIDSVMPLIRDFNGIIDADIAATVKLHRNMDFDMPSLHAAVNITGDSLRLIDADTYKTIGKWLLFKDKQDNLIKHMSVEMVVDSSMMEIYPFVFDLDRYRLGVQGYNDLDMNFNYHIAVLKSPLPFKFGVNIKGNPDDFKVRLGGAKFNEKQAVERAPLTDTTRVNLLRQIENVFRRGVDNSRFSRLNINARPSAANIDLSTDTLTRADSLRLIKEGLIPAPAGFDEGNSDDKSKKRKRKRGKKATAFTIDNGQTQESVLRIYATLPRRDYAPGCIARHGRNSV